MNKLRRVYTGGNVADGCAKTPSWRCAGDQFDVPGLVVELANHLSPSRLQLYWGMFATFVNS